MGAPGRVGAWLRGDLDTSFASDGKRTINFGGIDAASVVLAQPNGRIVVAGGGGPSHSFCVARLKANGTFDTTFSSSGRRRIDSAATTRTPSAERSSRTARSCSWGART
jgi:hypothetical protein